MCDPISIGMGVLSTGLGVAGAVGQQRQASAAAKAQTMNYYNNQAAANRAFEIDSRAITDRQIQEQDQAADKRAMMQREFDTTRAAAENRASEAGVAGLNLQALMGDLAGQQANREINTERNLEATTRQLQQQKVAQSTNMINRINSVERGRKPHPAMLALGIGGAVLGGLNTGLGQYRRGST